MEGRGSLNIVFSCRTKARGYSPQAAAYLERVRQRPRAPCGETAVTVRRAKVLGLQKYAVPLAHGSAPAGSDRCGGGWHEIAEACETSGRVAVLRCGSRAAIYSRTAGVTGEQGKSWNRPSNDWSKPAIPVGSSRRYVWIEGPNSTRETPSGPGASASTARPRGTRPGRLAWRKGPESRRRRIRPLDVRGLGSRSTRDATPGRATGMSLIPPNTAGTPQAAAHTKAKNAFHDCRPIRLRTCESPRAKAGRAKTVRQV
jgi:hypothetical protein